MKPFDREAYISVHIPYRMRAVAWMLDLMRRIGFPDVPRRMDIYIDGKRCIETNHYLLTNPVYEVGLMHARALLEFLGLTATKDKAALKQIIKRRYDNTDVGIEDFNRTSGPLAKVSPDEAYARYPGQTSEARRALASVIEHADRGVAHLSTGPDQSQDRRIEWIMGGSEAVLELTRIHFYDPLMRPRPAMGIRTIKLLRAPDKNASKSEKPQSSA